MIVRLDFGAHKYRKTERPNYWPLALTTLWFCIGIGTLTSCKKQTYCLLLNLTVLCDLNFLSSIIAVPVPVPFNFISSILNYFFYL